MSREREKKELGSLARDVRAYLLRLSHPYGEVPQVGMPSIVERHRQRGASGKTEAAAAIEATSLEKGPVPAPEEHKPLKKEVKSSLDVPQKTFEKLAFKKEYKNLNWDLHPMSGVVENNHLKQKMASLTDVTDPPLSVLLVLPEEEAPHRLFLENVSRAITKNFASASVRLYNEKIWQEAHPHILLIPHPLLKKKFPQIEIHTLFRKEERIYIPLANLDLYLHDLEAKRALWQTIQHAFTN